MEISVIKFEIDLNPKTQKFNKIFETNLKFFGNQINEMKNFILNIEKTLEFRFINKGIALQKISFYFSILVFFSFLIMGIIGSETKHPNVLIFGFTISFGSIVLELLFLLFLRSFINQNIEDLKIKVKRLSKDLCIVFKRLKMEFSLQIIYMDKYLFKKEYICSLHFLKHISNEDFENDRGKEVKNSKRKSVTIKSQNSIRRNMDEKIEKITSIEPEDLQLFSDD